jgi:hypothetical protein
MAGHPVVLFCKICGTGINLVRGDAIYKCIECEISPICESCYDMNYKVCIKCAEPLIRKENEEIEKVKKLEQQQKMQELKQKEEKKKIRDKKSQESVDAGRCIICNNKTRNSGFMWENGTRHGIKWPGNVIFKTGFQCDDCHALICEACWDKQVSSHWEDGGPDRVLVGTKVLVGSFQCPICGRYYSFRK